ncbi:MAG TPA: manganese transporter, partial [Spirochaetes bacterium]|nr:manganese transporter [Spirochaetota bacterium]
KKKESQYRLKVVATTGMIGDMVKNIAGDYVQVKVLCGPGIDPHTYKPTLRDVKNMRQADLVFYNGLHLEADLIDFLRTDLSEKAIQVTKDIPKSMLLDWFRDGKVEGYDPHIWNNLPAWALTTKTVAKALSKKNPNHLDLYRKNGELYAQKIMDLHQYAKRELAKLPEGDRILVSGHDAFQYFARSYGLQSIALMGVSTVAETGTREIRDIVNRIIKDEIKVIFTESILNNKGMQAVQKAVEANGKMVRLSDKELYSDALGRLKPVNTYLGMIKSNVDTILRELATGEFQTASR